MRPISADRATLGPGRLGRIWLLCLALTLVLGVAPAPGVHPSGLPIAWSLATPKVDDRQVLTGVLGENPGLVGARAGQLIIADKGYISAELDRWLAERGIRLLRPSYRNRTPRPDEHLLKPVRQLIESVNDTLKGQLDLELHGGRTIEGVGARIAQRLFAMTAAIWHNRTTG
ncbi:transposase [Actinoplanes sp. NPDC026623]|uniref:transposase n=1 Tax=Actinoplanes sp. NPDC026623 TaxID=3155610 RepID=UPI0033F6E1E8